MPGEARFHSRARSLKETGGWFYGVDSYGQLRCLDIKTGDRIWEDLTATPKARWSNIHMVRNGDRIWMFNERGELLIGTLSPEGFNEVSRTKLIEPTMEQLRRRGGVVGPGCFRQQVQHEDGDPFLAGQPAQGLVAGLVADGATQDQGLALAAGLLDEAVEERRPHRLQLREVALERLQLAAARPGLGTDRTERARHEPERPLRLAADGGLERR